MPSEYSPWWSRPRMTQAQIRKLQQEQEEARRIAADKLAKAKKSEEWKQEQELLRQMEEKLENGSLIETPVWPWENSSWEHEPEKILSFWQKIMLFIQKLFK